MARPSRAPIRLFYFRSRSGPNFGDELSPHLVALASGRPVQWTGIASCELMALGSIFEGVAKNLHWRTLRGIRAPIAVWGSGLIEDGPPLPDRVRRRFLVHAVRGPLTAARLGLNTIALGDPGLLAGQLVRRPTRPVFRHLIVPHVGHRRDPAVAALAAALGDSRVCDPGGDPLAILQEMAFAERVVASGLHGLICADSLGVPSVHVGFAGPLKGGNYKFEDYYRSIGRSGAAAIDARDLAAVQAALRDPDTTHLARVDGMVEGLTRAFPAHLR